MASNFRPLSAIFIIISAVFLSNGVNSVPAGEFDSMLDTLRIRGYDLFCNAIVTSDLQLDLLFSQNDTVNGRSYTLFAPSDSSLFALDMTQTASSYTDTLRFHVVPGRLSVSDLRRLPAGTSLPTLLPDRYLNVTQSSSRSGSVTINGVHIAVPGLFSRRHIVVHGLAGIISLRSYTAAGVESDYPVRAVSPVPSSDRRSFPPRNSLGSSENYPATAPTDDMFNTDYVTSRTESSPPMDNISPANRNAYAPDSEPAAAYSDFHADSAVNQAIHPPEVDEFDYLVDRTNRSPEDSDSPASSTESSTSMFVLPPVVSRAISPTSESPEYRRSAISAPPSELSDATVLATLSPCVWRPKENAGPLIEAFRSGSEGQLEKEFVYECD
ncbi:Fasciclin-like arabinogalactan protein 19 [Senna tora]|uniref:Fasciclin-like arabinogalactan protein 19 n=1 Tax=Senna tora TaxID=362788 RepID=A0A834XET5_9FABA|nr:Fasciclin-like arabinogalactan protein 19 [Senna tora]